MQTQPGPGQASTGATAGPHPRSSVLSFHPRPGSLAARARGPPWPWAPSSTPLAPPHRGRAWRAQLLEGTGVKEHHTWAGARSSAPGAGRLAWDLLPPTGPHILTADLQLRTTGKNKNNVVTTTSSLLETVNPTHSLFPNPRAPALSCTQHGPPAPASSEHGLELQKLSLTLTHRLGVCTGTKPPGICAHQRVRGAASTHTPPQRGHNPPPPPRLPWGRASELRLSGKSNRA